MSLWTPGGEHPVDRSGSGGAGESGADSAGAASPSPPSAAALSSEQQAEAQRVATEMAEVRDQLGQVPAAVVVANHAMGCYELAAIHLSSQPPKLAEAQLAIDAFGALLSAVEGRLGDDEPTLNDALAQIRMAFVQVKASWDSGADTATEDS
jgi:hypothetical protein